MKKIFVFLSFVLASTFAIAQPPGGGDRNPEQMKQRMKERMKPQLIEKTKITDAQADKVIDIYFDTRMETMKVMRNEELSKEEKEAKTKEIFAARDKKIKEAGLTDEQVKAVSDFYEEQRKQMQDRRPGGGQGGPRE